MDKPITWMGGSKSKVKKFHVRARQKEGVSGGVESKRRKRAMKAEKGSKNVFKDLGFSDSESANLEARSALMVLLEREIKKLKVPQSEVAKLLGVKPPRISELLNGKLDKFSLDLLVVYLDRLGKTVEFNITKKAA